MQEVTADEVGGLCWNLEGEGGKKLADPAMAEARVIDPQMLCIRDVGGQGPSLRAEVTKRLQVSKSTGFCTGVDAGRGSLPRDTRVLGVGVCFRGGHVASGCADGGRGSRSKLVKDAGCGRGPGERGGGVSQIKLGEGAAMSNGALSCSCSTQTALSYWVISMVHRIPLRGSVCVFEPQLNFLPMNCCAKVALHSSHPF